MYEVCKHYDIPYERRHCVQCGQALKNCGLKNISECGFFNSQICNHQSEIPQGFAPYVMCCFRLCVQTAKRRNGSDEKRNEIKRRCNMTSRKQRKHWYHQTIYECVLCGKLTIYRERRYGKKPKDPEKWYNYHQMACEIHFF